MPQTNEVLKAIENFDELAKNIGLSYILGGSASLVYDGKLKEANDVDIYIQLNDIDKLIEEAEKEGFQFDIHNSQPVLMRNGITYEIHSFEDMEKLCEQPCAYEEVQINGRIIRKRPTEMIIRDYVNAVRASPTWSGMKYIERLKKLGYDPCQLIPELDAYVKSEKEILERLIEQGTPKKVLRFMGLIDPNARFISDSKIKRNINFNLEDELFSK